MNFEDDKIQKKQALITVRYIDIFFSMYKFFLFFIKNKTHNMIRLFLEEFFFWRSTTCGENEKVIIELIYVRSFHITTCQIRGIFFICNKFSKSKHPSIL